MTRFPDNNPTDDVGRTRLRREYIGDVAVDTGTIAIVDPGYLTRTSGLFVADADKLFADCCDVGDGAILRNVAGSPLAVSLQSFGGDGIFPVYAERDADGLTTRVVIDFSRERSPRLPNGDHVGEAARIEHGITDDATIMGLSPWGDGIVDESAITDAAIMAELLEGDDTDDESAILDGPQGIASRLRELPDGFADFAHSYVAQILRDARDRELYGDVERKVGEWLRCGFDEFSIRGDASPTIHNPNRGSAAGFAMQEADERVELALHAIVDAMLDAYQLQDVTGDADAMLDAVDGLRARVDLSTVGNGWAPAKGTVTP